jgi:hypothetical protein
MITMERKKIIRLLTEQIVVDVPADTEPAEVVIIWRGGQIARYQFMRTLSRYKSLGNYDRLMDRIVQPCREGLTIKEITAQLTQEGYCTPRTQKGYPAISVRQVLCCRGLTGGIVNREWLKRHEWWLPDLTR